MARHLCALQQREGSYPALGRAAPTIHLAEPRRLWCLWSANLLDWHLLSDWAVNCLATDVDDGDPDIGALALSYVEVVAIEHAEAALARHGGVPDRAEIERRVHVEVIGVTKAVEEGRVTLHDTSNRLCNAFAGRHDSQERGQPDWMSEFQKQVAAPYRVHELYPIDESRLRVVLRAIAAACSRLNSSDTAGDSAVQS